MITFYLIRHGQKEGTSGDPSLDKDGKLRAEQTAKFFKDKQIRKIFSSPLKRTRDTAEIIAKELGLKIKTDDRLYERINWGDKEGESYEEFWSEWQKTDLNRDYQPRHGYSSRESGNRMEAFLNDVSNELGSGVVLVVTSGGIIGDLLRNKFPEKDLPLVINEKSKARYMEISECSLTILKKDNNNLALEKIGDVSHLYS
jgi:broad specificity phosphatase PhoE